VFVGEAYCWARSPVEQKLLTIAPYLIVIYALAIGYAGLNLLAVVIGTLVGIYQRDRAWAGMITAVIAITITSFGLFVMYQFVLQTLLNDHVDLLTVLLIPLLPYVLAFGLVRVSSRIARKIA
jgi:hypothetical protein